MKGILFKDWKHRAIRENPDREWLTRRVIKPQPIEQVAELKEHSQLKEYWIPYALDRRMVNNNQGSHKNDCGYLPDYRVGEVVYIKEAIEVHATMNDNHLQGYLVIYHGRVPKMVWLKDLPLGFIPKSFYQKMFMPEWAARDFIQITDVRADRLQKISRADIEREGCSNAVNNPLFFPKVWDSINPKYPWEDNSWVWVYSFKVNLDKKG